MDCFIESWQFLPARIDPVFFSIGPVRIMYYSLMYIVAFACTYILVLVRIRREDFDYTPETIQNIFVWAILGLLIGARLGYVLFYNLDFYIHRPWAVLFPFEFHDGVRFVGIRGMSYHGGLAGVVVAALVFCRRHSISFRRFADLFCPVIPLGYTFGRIGNFINGELYGRVTDVPWGMYFPLDVSHQLRHPSQLYEAFGEGIVLFLVLWSLRKWQPFPGYLLGLYLIGYGVARYCIEFTREPDPQLGFVIASQTMGQVLCLLMILCGMGLLGAFYLSARREPA